jgi:hypothetical protein
MQKDNPSQAKYNSVNKLLSGVIPELTSFCLIHLGTLVFSMFSTMTDNNVEQGLSRGRLLENSLIW